MGKVIESPVKKFPGTVTLKDPIPLDACVTWEQALDECGAKLCNVGQTLVSKIVKGDEKAREDLTAHYLKCKEDKTGCREPLPETQAQARIIPSIKTCIEEWKIEGFDLSNPPGSPKLSRSKLIAWLVKEINDLYIDEGLDQSDPNG